MSDKGLWQVYGNAKFRPLHSPLPKVPFAVITAHNPRSQIVSDRQNQANQQGLIKELSALGHSYSQVLVGNEDFSYSEPSLAVAMAKSDAIALGKRYQQNAIYWVENGSLYLLPCLMQGQQQQLLGAFDGFLIADQLE